MRSDLWHLFLLAPTTHALVHSGQANGTSSGSSRSISLNVPNRLYSVIRPSDGSWQSFSIEFSYITDYFGNKSHPNMLSYNVLANLYERSGTNVIIRAGGSTANVATYNASQPVAVLNYWNGSTNVGLTGAFSDQLSNSTIGPAWFETSQTSPKGTKWIYGLNFRDNTSAGVPATVDVASIVYNTPGDSLYAFELGNGFEKWGGRYRPSDWSPRTYAENVIEYADLFDRHILGNNSDVEPIIQMGTLQGSGGAFINQPWNSEVVLSYNITRNGQIKSTSQHDTSPEMLV